MKLKLITLSVLSAALALAQFPTGAQNPNPIPPPIYPSAGGTVVEATYYSGNQTTTIAAQNLLCTPGNFTGTANQNNNQITVPQGVTCPAGMYRLSASMETVTAGSGNTTMTLQWHQATATQGASGNVTGTLTISGTNVVTGSAVFWSDGTANPTLATTYTGTGTYAVHAVLERLQ